MNQAINPFNLIFLFLGCICGTFTGLLPGIHPNTLIPISLLILPYIGSQNYVCFLIGIVITHYFINYIPSSFIGVPDDETAVSVLPLHNLTLKGYGYEGVMLCGFGGFFGIIISIFLFFILLFINIDIYGTYQSFKPFIPYVLILLLFISVIFSKNRFWSIVVIILSGLFGIEVLYNHSSVSNILTAIFTGMFGIPLLLENLKKNKINHQIITFPNLNVSILKYVFVGTIGGFIRIFLPAIGGAQINFFLSKLIRENNIKNFLVSQGAITLSNEVFSILALLLIGYGRSGTAVAIKNLSINLHFNIIVYMLIGAGVGYAILCSVSKYFLRYISYVNYGKISFYLVLFCSAVVFILGYFSNYLFYYLVVYAISACIGILCVKSKVNMSYMMSVLVFPTVLYYIMH
ncbi:tripartite tricarboxylate transporter permease [Methanothermococcus sp.]|uniref:tripartite tricarboxylate transporter permease n=1 Tax=Methanothermococcus sp. TaxID=2614238 RepID=UPI0025E4B92A|nr:tripartite tricarboxylate transporter permease [Methanothermococcus sp.]